jgi:hypothetical protein
VKKHKNKKNHGIALEFGVVVFVAKLHPPEEKSGRGAMLESSALMSNPVVSGHIVSSS